MLTRKSSVYKLLLLLIVFSLTTLGQESSKFDIRVKFHPSALVALSRPSVLGSVEFKFKRIGVDIAYGQQYGFPFSSDPDTQRVKNYGYQYRIEMKYYFRSFKNNNQTIPFISTGYCKMYTQRNLTTDWFSGYKFDPSLAILDNIHVFSFNYGICNHFGRLVTEGVIGGGVRFRTSELVYANGIAYEKASRTWPHLSISLRIGYILFKKPKA